MRKKVRFKTPGIRQLLLVISLLTMLAAGGYYLYHYQFFMVDDTLFEAEIRTAARKYNLDSRLVRAVIYEESRFRPGAIGKAGEIGLMQIMPDQAAVDWARAQKVQPLAPGLLFSPALNLEIGCWYLSDGLRRFREHKSALVWALVRYNAGASRANAWKPKDKNLDSESCIKLIKIASTRKYVNNILKRYQRYQQESAGQMSADSSTVKR